MYKRRLIYKKIKMKKKTMTFLAYSKVNVQLKIGFIGGGGLMRLR